jgi:hypothetical protein
LDLQLARAAATRGHLNIICVNIFRASTSHSAAERRAIDARRLRRVWAGASGMAQSLHTAAARHRRTTLTANERQASVEAAAVGKTDIG